MQPQIPTTTLGGATFSKNTRDATADKKVGIESASEGACHRFQYTGNGGWLTSRLMRQDTRRRKKSMVTPEPLVRKSAWKNQTKTSSTEWRHWKRGLSRSWRTYTLRPNRKHGGQIGAWAWTSRHTTEHGNNPASAPRGIGAEHERGGAESRRRNGFRQLTGAVGVRASERKLAHSRRGSARGEWRQFRHTESGECAPRDPREEQKPQRAVRPNRGGATAPSKLKWVGGAGRGKEMVLSDGGQPGAARSASCSRLAQTRCIKASQIGLGAFYIENAPRCNIDIQYIYIYMLCI